MPGSGRAEHEVVGEPVRRELGSVRLAYRDRPGRAEPARNQPVANRRRRAPEQHGAVRRRQAREVLDVLDQERDAGKRPDLFTGGYPLVERVRLRECIIIPARHHGIELRVRLFDSGERTLNELTGGHLPPAHGLGDVVQHALTPGCVRVLPDRLQGIAAGSRTSLRG
jgi:hypothetical protein